MKAKLVKLPLYRTHVQFYSGDLDLVNTYRSKRYGAKLPLSAPGYDGCAYDLGGSAIVWIEKHNDIGALAHELIHASFYIMNHVDIPLTESSQESWAYLIGYLTEQFLDKNGWKTYTKANINNVRRMK